MKWDNNKPKIIGFCGFARTGKNTAAEHLGIIQEIVENLCLLFIALVHSLQAANAL